MENNKKYAKPRTIEELLAFCRDKGMPLEKMRFFIGEDYRGAEAFGIYRDDDGDFVVYKNKSDASRAVRYKGPDEAYAVNEIYEKIKAEAELRKRKTHMYRADVSRAEPSYTARASSSMPKTPKLRKFRGLIIFAVIAVLIIAFAHLDKSPSRGYYHYNNNDYYYYDDDWYGYDSGLGAWMILDTVDAALSDNYDDYYVSRYYDDYYTSEYYDETGGASDFTESEYYDETSDDSYSSSYYDDDDDYDWDDWGSDDSGWDSWDSGDTDWDSDW
ncbi:MAG: hypothetical protein IJG50_07685 [Clostridia bacterium]|nr:hypothetical protein [Clostridia bacterium]